MNLASETVSIANTYTEHACQYFLVDSPEELPAGLFINTLGDISSVCCSLHRISTEFQRNDRWGSALPGRDRHESQGLEEHMEQCCPRDESPFLVLDPFS
jgi:hypothetical protein